MADQWQNAIGKGFGLAMDEIYNGLIGKGPQSALRKKDLTKFSTDDLWAATNLIPGGGAAKVATPVVKSGVKAAAATTAKALVNKALKKPQVAVRIPSARIPDIIESGRLKNALEVPRPKEYFSTDPFETYTQPRLKAENKLMGIPYDAPATARPVYGFTTVPGLPAISGNSQLSKITQLLSSANPKAKAYGDVTGVIKKPSGTYSIGDSFSTTTPIEQFGSANKSAVNSILKGTDPLAASGPQYIENQLPYAAGELSNFKKFLVDNPDQVKSLAAQLKKAGYDIPVKTSLEGKITAIQNAIKKVQSTKGPISKLKEKKALIDYANRPQVEG